MFAFFELFCFMVIDITCIMYAILFNDYHLSHHDSFEREEIFNFFILIFKKCSFAVAAIDEDDWTLVWVRRAEISARSRSRLLPAHLRHVPFPIVKRVHTIILNIPFYHGGACKRCVHGSSRPRRRG